IVQKIYCETHFCFAPEGLPLFEDALVEENYRQMICLAGNIF
ncbi:MAG: hypothetical protein JWQ09_4113, partial [Segetibacter sp.]|nr:hypothetical protein [Segetibacter sp.]